MNIRMDSNEVRFRITQDEVDALIDKGIITEAVSFPGHQFFFNVKLHNHIGLHHKENQVTFCLDSSLREKLKNPDDGLVAEVLEDRAGSPVCFKLEVDKFKREKRK